MINVSKFRLFKHEIINAINAFATLALHSKLLAVLSNNTWISRPDHSQLTSRRRRTFLRSVL